MIECYRIVCQIKGWYSKPTNLVGNKERCQSYANQLNNMLIKQHSTVRYVIVADRVKKDDITL